MSDTLLRLRVSLGHDASVRGYATHVFVDDVALCGAYKWRKQEPPHGETEAEQLPTCKRCERRMRTILSRYSTGELGVALALSGFGLSTQNHVIRTS